METPTNKTPATLQEHMPAPTRFDQEVEGEKEWGALVLNSTWHTVRSQIDGTHTHTHRHTQTHTHTHTD